MSRYLGLSGLGDQPRRDLQHQHPRDNRPTPETSEPKTTAMSFPNVYAHRKVAETSAKSCDICFKPSTSVLITTDNKVRAPNAVGTQSLTGCRDV